MEETIFAKGIYFDKAREGAPDFVKGRVSIKAEEAIAFIQENKNEKGYVNLDLLKAKEGGKLYFKLNTYKKEVKPEDVVEKVDLKMPYDGDQPAPFPEDDPAINPEDIPF